MSPIAPTSDWSTFARQADVLLAIINRSSLDKEEIALHNQPPILEEMWIDIQHVIATIAHQYTDRSCPSLHYDELVGQGNEKLARLIDKGYLGPPPPKGKGLPTRKEWFAFFRTAINNHIRGQVQKHRFTIKRTGIKPPPKHERYLSNESTKPIEISLDDEDAHLQVGETSTHGDIQYNEMVGDINTLLTPLEQLVCQQMREPNAAACLIAEMDSMRGKSLDKSVDPSIKATHQAAGLGMDEATYKEVLGHVQRKVLNYMQREETADDMKVNLAITNLEHVFSVQVPKHFDPVTIKRLFTLLARRYIDRVDIEAKQWLLDIGAKVPEMRGPTMPCFGVLYLKHSRICEACSIRQACSVEAANFGLGEMLLHPEVLGTKQVRIATLGGPPAPSAAVSSPVQDIIVDDDPAVNVRDDDIMHYLSENFRSFHIRRGSRVEMGFKHKDRLPSGAERVIFCASRKSGSLSLRFCNPDGGLKDKLESVKNGSYLSKDVSASDAISMINSHAASTFKS